MNTGNQITSQEQQLINYGFWMRGFPFATLQYEKAMLDERDNLTDAQLELKRHGPILAAAQSSHSSPGVFATVSGIPAPTWYDVLSNLRPTPKNPYSSATFVKQGLPIRLFSSPDMALMIRPVAQRIVYFYDGGAGEQAIYKENGQCRIDFIQESLIGGDNPMVKDEYATGNDYSHGTDCKHENITIDRICARLTQLYKWHQAVVGYSPLCWNEGLIAYKRNHVFGIHVSDPSDTALLSKAEQMRQALGLPDLPVYHYEKTNGSVTLYYRSLAQTAAMYEQNAPAAGLRR